MNIYSMLNISKSNSKNPLKNNEPNKISDLFYNSYGPDQINNFIMNSNLENNNSIK